MYLEMSRPGPGIGGSGTLVSDVSVAEANFEPQLMTRRRSGDQVETATPPTTQLVGLGVVWMKRLTPRGN